MELNYLDLLISLITGTIVWFSYKSYIAPPHDKYLTFWPRFWAPSIDDIILWVPLSLLPSLTYSFFDHTEHFFVGSYLFSLATYFGYSIYFHGKFGATIGKMATGVLVVDAKTEQPITYSQAFARDAIPLFFSIALLFYYPFSTTKPLETESASLTPFSFILGFWFLAEVLTMLTNNKRRALHDFIAGTVVIRYNIEE